MRLRSPAQAWSEATDVLTVLQEGNFGAAKEDRVLTNDVAGHQVSSAA